MNLKSLPLILVLPALMLVGVACSSSPTEIDIEATVQARVEATAIAQPTATPAYDQSRRPLEISWSIGSTDP